MKPVKQPYAGRLERVLANLIDTIIMLVPTFLLATIMAGNNGLAMLAVFLINGFYYTHFTASAWQATPGQRLLSVYVIRRDGRLITQREALVRFLAFILPTLPLYTSLIPEQIAQVMALWLIVVWFAPILFTEERIGMHDRICDMRVMAGKL